MTSQRWDKLLAHLQELAAFFYGGLLFRTLCSAERSGPAGPPRFALALLEEQGVRTFEYRPEAAAFVATREHAPRTRCAAGMTCWAADLLATFEGELSPYALLVGRARYWHDETVPVSAMSELSKYFHPLRRPDVWSAAYERAIHDVVQGAIRVGGTGREVVIRDGYW